MHVHVNQKGQTLRDNSNLLELLGTFEIQDPSGIAIAVNSTIIPKSRWSEHELNENDNVTVIRATQGG